MPTCLHYMPGSFIKPLKFDAGSQIRGSCRTRMRSRFNWTSRCWNTPVGEMWLHHCWWKQTRPTSSNVIVRRTQRLGLIAIFYLPKNLHKCQIIFFFLFPWNPNSGYWKKEKSHLRHLVYRNFRYFWKKHSILPQYKLFIEQELNQVIISAAPHPHKKKKKKKKKKQKTK